MDFKYFGLGICAFVNLNLFFLVTLFKLSECLSILNNLFELVEKCDFIVKLMDRTFEYSVWDLLFLVRVDDYIFLTEISLDSMNLK